MSILIQEKNEGFVTRFHTRAKRAIISVETPQERDESDDL